MKRSRCGPVCRTAPARCMSPWTTIFLIASAAIVAPTAAMAADNAASGGAEAIFIAELGLLLLVGRLMGEAAQRLGQPAVMGQLIGGLLLGPSVLGLIWPAAQHALFPGTAEQKSMINAARPITRRASARRGATSRRSSRISAHWATATTSTCAAPHARTWRPAKPSSAKPSAVIISA